MPKLLPKDATILVTGTSSGIGLELAKLLWKTNYRVVLTALPNSLPLLHTHDFYENERFHFRALDVRDYKSVKELIHEVNMDWGGVDGLINNAGISYRCTVEEMTGPDEANQMSINYFGPMTLIRSVLPSMREKRRGRILNVSSVGGMMAMPTMSSYSASKFALEGASEALWYEMRPWNVQVSLISPGFINSLAFKKVFYSQKFDLKESPYRAYYENMTEFVEKLMQRSPSTSKSVAEKILKVLHSRNPRLHNAATWDAYLFYYMRRLLPRFFYHRFLYSNLPGIKTWTQSSPKNYNSHDHQIERGKYPYDE